MEIDQDEIVVTVKNYNMEGGLSKVIHTFPEDQVFQIKGPMGKGLGIEKSGVHMAFTGGTGSLVFVDLAAFLVRMNLNLLKDHERGVLGPDFKLIFYVSFPNREDSVGLKLLEGLHALTKKLNLNNFELVARFSNQKGQRWDANFIQR